MSAKEVIADCLHDTSLDRMPTCLRRSDTILSALRSAGWAVVPVEPTEVMLAAAQREKFLGMNISVQIRQAIKAAQEDSK